MSRTVLRSQDAFCRAVPCAVQWHGNGTVNRFLGFALIFPNVVPDRETRSLSRPAPCVPPPRSRFISPEKEKAKAIQRRGGGSCSRATEAAGGAARSPELAIVERRRMLRRRNDSLIDTCDATSIFFPTRGTYLTYPHAPSFAAATAVRSAYSTGAEGSGSALRGFFRGKCCAQQINRSFLGGGGVPYGAACTIGDT